MVHRQQSMPGDKQQAQRILIVEDEPMIALTLEDLLVDANLAGVSASPVALALAARGLPFILLSGYSPEQLQGAFPGATFIRKPCRPAQLIQALNAIALKP